ncbi:MAG TPA: type III-B CRISPR-associated protein Cas10/Cmr2 [Deltaproteobacteria bacterium]|nr:type III-B CRISPR-associated protein Cas10/Cmr2 [Deltaproteobacteria bacterium]
MTAHVLVFAIGPVQGFISTARRGRDLWFSSWLLSELARAAAEAAREHLVMPTQDLVDDERAAISNKITLYLVDADPAGVALAMEAALRQRLDGLTSELLARPELRGLVDAVRARQQVLDLPEIAWASASVLLDRWYPRARALAERLLAARKSSKHFGQPPWGDSVHKSSLDGQRESVLNIDQHRGERRPEDIQQLFRIGVGPKERLCGVGLLKRLGHRIQPDAGGRVLSTSHVASWSTRRRFHEPGSFQDACRECFERFEAILRRHHADLSRTPRRDPVLGHTDGHILYESRLRDLFPGGEVPEEVTTALRRLYREWSAAAAEHGQEPIKPPTPYYAVLVADGDKMGAALNALEDPGKHREVTQILARFAARAEEIVEAHHGHCVYAGGDDVLALLPVTTVLRCAGQLNDAFADVGQAFEDHGAPKTTMSAGVHIAHHLHPLQDALAGGRAAEQHAKQVLERDAFAVQVDKRSGVPVRAGGKWRAFEQFEELLGAFQGSQSLPRGLPYVLRGIADRLPDPEAPDRSSSAQEGRDPPPLDLGPIRAAEVARILSQKDLTPDQLWIPQIEGEIDPALDLRALADRLLVARTLSGMEADRGR